MYKMTVSKIQSEIPYYLINGSDIVNGKVAGIAHIGAKVYNLDTGTWYVVRSDMTLASLSIGTTTIQDPLGTPLKVSGDGQAWVRAREMAREASGEIFLLDNPADGEVVVVSDGTDSVAFEFDSNESVTEGNVAVVIAETPALTVTNLASAINTATDLDITATQSDPAETFCTLLNDFVGEIGNVAITTTSVNVTVTGMEDGLDEVSLRTLQEEPVEFKPDLNANAKSVRLVMDAEAKGSCEIPDTAKIVGVKVDVGTVMRCGLNTIPEAPNSITGAAVLANWKPGVFVNTDWTWFNIGTGTSRVLRFFSNVGDAVFVVVM
jgi:hypothetical protein